MSTAINDWEHARGVLGRRVRDHGPNSAEAAEARRNFEIARLAEHVRRVVESAPPLTDEQRARLASLLAGAA